MGILARQLRSVIQWEQPDPSHLFHRWSERGDEIKNASKLVVGPGQGCIFVYEGRVEGIYLQEGLFEIRTANLPFFTTLSKFMQNFVSEHKVGIYFFRTAKILNLKWGTSSLIKYEDPKYKFPVGLRAFGNYSMQITEPGTFFSQIVGGRDPFLVDDIREPLNARLVQPLVDFFAEAGYTYTQIDPKREEIAAALSIKLAPEFSRMGFKLDDFRIQGTSFDEDTMRRINRIADVSADVQAASSAGLSYAQMQQLSALRDAAKNEGTAGMAVGMGVGMGMGVGGLGAYQSPLVQLPQPPADEPAAKLKTLKSLLDQGLISPAEYEQKKKDILARL